MRAIAILLCLATVTANAQSGGPRAPPEDSLTPPPITSAPRDELPPPPPSTTAPEEEFLPLPSPPPQASPAPAPAAVTPPPPPPRATVAPPPPPPSEPQRVRPPSVGPVEPPGRRAERYSRYSAGPGGTTLAVTAGLSGIVTGALLGSAFDASREPTTSAGYTGAVIGGLALGTAATLYQYFVPVGRREGLLAGGAATSALVASLAIANSADMNSKDRALLTFTATQASIVATLLLTSGSGDVSPGDAGLVGATALYGTLITSLVEYIHSQQSRQSYNALPLLLAPALGMAAGGLLALPLDLSPQLLFELTAFPLLTGTVALLLGTRFADGVTVAKTMLITMGGTFLLVGLINGLSAYSTENFESSERSASSFQAMPVPVVMSAGRGNEGIAAGPGLFMRF
jgi:hypothetical protein